MYLTIGFQFGTQIPDQLSNERRSSGTALAISALGLIPAALTIDRCPFAGGDRSDADGVGDEPIPCVAASLDDVVVALPDGPAELVAAEIFPHVLDRFELG